MLVNYQETKAVPVGEKCQRRVLLPGPAMMLVEFRFQKGGVGVAHKHEEHEQVGYVAQTKLQSALQSLVFLAGSRLARRCYSMLVQSKQQVTIACWASFSRQKSCR